MSTTDPLADLRCHCAATDGPDGHALDTEGCESDVKAGTYRDGWCSRDHRDVVRFCTTCHSPARGTCPSCRKQVQVRQIETRGLVLGRSGEAKRGSLLQVAPGMAPHRHAGKPCSGAGQPPVETRYTPGRELGDWVKAGLAFDGPGADAVA